MSISHRIKTVCLLFLVALCYVSCNNQPAKQIKVSEFASYEGYSEAVYDEWERASEYIEARDGTKLARRHYQAIS